MFAVPAILGLLLEMNTEKRRVPKDLHRELSEYASLLRALRARDAMDLSKYLVKSSPFAIDNDNVEDSPCPGPSDLSHPANTPPPARSLRSQGKQKETATEPLQQIRRDHWTRWPLLLPDVLLPEWTLQDEVAVIVSQVLKSRQHPPAFPATSTFPDPHDVESDEGNDHDDDRSIDVMDMDVESDDPDPPFYAPYLTSVVAKYLATTFAMLASHTPARPASMQNRIEPLNWRTVVDVVVSCGIEISNPRIVENVVNRMEAICGPSILPIEDSQSTSSRPVERVKSKQAAIERLEKIMENAKANHFVQESLPPDPGPFFIPVTLQKKSKRTIEEEAAFKGRTKNDYDGPPRKRRKSNKKQPRPEFPTTEAVHVDADEGGPVQTRRSTRIRKDVNYLHDPLFKL